MAVSEQARRRLHEALEAQLGEDNAATLMDSLPPAGWGDVATKQDLEHLRVLMKKDMEHLHVLTKQDVEHLRVSTKQDLEHLRVSVNQDLAHLWASMGQIEASLHQEVEQLRVGTRKDLDHFAVVLRTEMGGYAHQTSARISELEANMHQAFRHRAVMLFSSVVGIAGLILAAARVF